MKKIDGKTSGKHYQSVCLFREDLDNIVNLLSENAEPVEISDSEYEYESLDDVKNNKGVNPKTLKINSYTPYISLEFKRDVPAIWFYRADSDQKSIFLYDSIEKILNKRKRILFKIINPSIGIFFGLVFLSVAIIPSDYVKILLPQFWQRITFMIITLGFPAISLLGQSGLFYSLYLSKKHESGNFFQRQKDDLIKLLIGAIIGGIITYIVTSILQK